MWLLPALVRPASSLVYLLTEQGLDVGRVLALDQAWEERASELQQVSGLQQVVERSRQSRKAVVYRLRSESSNILAWHPLGQKPCR